MISDGKNNCLQNKYNKSMKYKNVLPNNKNANIDPVFDGVGLAGFKSRSNAFLLA